MTEVTGVDRALDEMLVQLGGMVLRLSSPQVTRSREERRALACSVNQYSLCAACSDDPRVQQLKTELEETIRPRLRLVASRSRDRALHTTGTRRAATAAGEITSMSSGTRHRSVSRTRGASLPISAPSITKPSKPLLMTSLHFCT